MKTVEIKKGTWHFWLANAFGWNQFRTEEQYTVEDGKRVFQGFTTVPNDFCSYSRRVVLGVLLTAIFSMAALLYVVGIGIGLHYYWMWVFNHAIKSDNVQQIGIAMIWVTILLGGFVGMKIWVDNNEWDWKQRRREKQEAREVAKLLRTEDPFLKSAYATFKNKMCFKIDITE